MVDIRMAGPQDPLPTGRSVILMRRMAEDAPQQVVVEMIVTETDGSEETSNPIREDGRAMSWDEAIAAAQQRAEADGLDLVWCVDRTAGPRASEILQHGGDHTFNMDQLEDTDMEEGEPGSDMRDRGPDGAPRRF